MFDVLENKKLCTGCSACIAACNIGAVSLQASVKDGFLYPEIDEAKCINCEKCKEACPINKELDKNTGRKCFSTRLIDRDELKNSSSGGAFYSLAKSFLLEKNGYVCGAVYIDEFKAVKHIVTNSLEKVKKMRGSKYVQSSKENCFSDIRNLLECGKYVLFSGCPCEIAGLTSYLKKDYNNLLKVELICDGVTSPYALKSYTEQWKGKSIQEMSMRYKKDGVFFPFYFRIHFSDNTTYCRNFFFNEVGIAFSILARESCYSCRFKGNASKADVILGDFYVDGKIQECNREGLSAVICLTHKGEAEIEALKKNTEFKEMKWEETTYTTILKNNPRLESSRKSSEDRERFAENMMSKGLNKACKNTYSIKRSIYELIIKCPIAGKKIQGRYE